MDTWMGAWFVEALFSTLGGGSLACGDVGGGVGGPSGSVAIIPYDRSVCNGDSDDGGVNSCWDDDS